MSLRVRSPRNPLNSNVARFYDREYDRLVAQARRLLGAFQFNPAIGMLLDQAWVR